MPLRAPYVGADVSLGLLTQPGARPSAVRGEGGDVPAWLAFLPRGSWARPLPIPPSGRGGREVTS